MKRFDQIFTLEVNKTKEEIIHVLETRGENAVVGENSISVNHNPPWYMVFAGRGIVTMNLNNTGTAAKSVMQCVLSPSVADARTIAMFLLWNIPLWAVLLYFFPWNVLLLVVFFVEWLIMAFIAIPILFLAMLIFTVYILSITFRWPGIFFLLVTWSFLLLIVNASVRYNRGELKRWVVNLFRS